MPRRPRIALVTYAMYCGGVEAFLLRLGRFLSQQGCDVEVLTTLEPGEWFERWSELQIKAQHISGHGQFSFLTPLRHSKQVASTLAGGDFDVIFLNHASHAQASLAQLPENVAVIPILHNDVGPIYDVGCGNKDAWNVAVGVSPKVAASARLKVPGRPIVQISSGVDLPGETPWRNRRQAGGRMELIYIGRLEHTQKGILWLPDIYQACLDRGLDVGLTVVGHGPDSEKLRRKLGDFGLEAKTRLLKGLTPELIYDLLLDSHVLLMPSHYEGLPIAPLESQACGCVPVASRLPGITDAAMEDGETGILVDVGDVSGFAQAVAALYHDPALWSRMSRAGHERVRHGFSVDAMGRSYLELIKDARDGHYPLPRPRKHQPAVDLTLFSWSDFVPIQVRQLGKRGRGWLGRVFHARKATSNR